MIEVFSFYVGKLFLLWLVGFGAGKVFSLVGNILKRSSGTF